MKQELFTEVYEEYHDLIRKYIYAQLGSAEDAKELMQDVFCDFYREMTGVDEDLAKPWLYLTARRKCIDYYRKHRKEEKRIFPESFDLLELVSPDGAERLAERDSRVELACEILYNLKNENEKWYEAVDAVCVMGMQQSDAAEHLNLSVQALRARLSRARKYVRRKFLEEYRKL